VGRLIGLHPEARQIGEAGVRDRIALEPIAGATPVDGKAIDEGAVQRSLRQPERQPGPDTPSQLTGQKKRAMIPLLC
jgi:hypothetical protein